MMLLTDDRLIDAMRVFVTATNRMQHLTTTHDLAQLERATIDHHAAAFALQEALLQRGWRLPAR